MLVQQLRESCGYLSDAGWEETAKLMLRAADEIEQLAGSAGRRTIFWRIGPGHERRQESRPSAAAPTLSRSLALNRAWRLRWPSYSALLSVSPPCLPRP